MILDFLQARQPHIFKAPVHCHTKYDRVLN